MRMSEAEGFDRARSDKVECDFTKYFGIRPDSDFLCTQRADVHHHMEASCHDYKANR